eukprot:SAG22_NODE_25_length_30107_cov_28.456412_18_plen_1854_part_00
MVTGAGVGPMDPLQPLTSPPAQAAARSVADLMPTLLLPSNATYAVDLNYDVSPGEVRVAGTQDVTIRGTASLGRRVQYGGVNHAFTVTESATLQLERIEISNRTYEHLDNSLLLDGRIGTDAIIRVQGDRGARQHLLGVSGADQSASIIMIDCVFARNPVRVLYLENAAADITRCVFSQNVVVNSKESPIGQWWDQGMLAPPGGVFDENTRGGPVRAAGAVIHVADRGTLRVDDSDFNRNGLRSITSAELTRPDSSSAHEYSCPLLQGGAIAFEGDRLELANSRFVQNTLEHWHGCDTQLQGGGSGFYQQGAAVWIFDTHSTTGAPCAEYTSAGCIRREDSTVLQALEARPVAITQCTFLDNAPSENGAVWWDRQLVEPCSDFVDAVHGHSCALVQESRTSLPQTLCTGGLQLPGGTSTRPLVDMNFALYVHGGRDVCQYCNVMAPCAPGAGCRRPDPASAFQCPASSRFVADAYTSIGASRGASRFGCGADGMCPVHYYGRVLDNSPNPQDFGWWQTAASEGRRRLDFKTDDVQPNLLTVDRSMFATMQAQIALLMQHRDADRKEIQEVKARVAKCEAAATNGAKAGTQPRLSNNEPVEQIAALQTTLDDLSNKTAADIQQMSVRLDQCELDSFEQIVNRRRNQEQSSSACGVEAVQSMLVVCCSSGPAGNGHRLLQVNGCDSLPPTCSLECSSQFISIFENCQGEPVLEQLPPGQLAQWRGFLGQCQEVQQSAAELSVADAQPAMIFHCLVLDDAAQSQADMFGQVTSPAHPLEPLQPIVTPPSPTPVSDGGAAQVQEFRRVCTRANLTICAPPCNQASDGFLLSILIGGRGTMMTCNQEEGVFSWQGQSALGSCITRRAQTWLENIITHAAGTFALQLAASVAVLTAADLVAGQSAMLHGAVGGSPPVWTYSGEGSAFIVGAGAELEISVVTVAATSGLAFQIADSSTIMVTSLQLQKGDGSADAISCAALATGVGQAGLTCADTGFGSVNVAGPLFISTSGTGFGMGATKYMGDDRGVFEEAVSTREPGLYTCQISHDEIVTLTLPVESAMHVSIVGDDSMPQWSFTSDGLTFTVAVHAYLNLAYVTVPGGQVSLMQGGEVSLDHVQMQGTQLHVVGSLAVSNSQLTDVQFETEAAAVMTMDSVTLFGTGEEALAFPIGCSTTINGGEIRNVELQVTSDGELVLMGTALYVEGMAVSVATGVSLTVSTSRLIHGEVRDPFPCNGANMVCTGQHAGSVIVAGPASINTAAPLVCADESAGSCLSGYVDMPSCLADIARGLSSCFVYLQRDTGELGTISVNAGEHFEIHGNQGEPKLRIQADFGVSGGLILADVQVAGGSGDGGQMSVEAGGELTFERVQMESGVLTVAGVVSLLESSFVDVVVTGSSGSELSVSGGTLNGSTIGVTSGRMSVDSGCVLMDSPVSVGGVEGLVMISGVELQSDGSSMPLTVEADGAATVTATTFRSTADDITAVSVAEGGSLTVGESQLVGADGSTDPFPCDGRLPDCAGEHDGSVVVAGPSAINMAAPLVCDVETRECDSGQVFTDDRIAEFVSTVNAGASGMYGLQLSTDGQIFEVDGLSVSSGQDVRIFSSARGSTLEFTGEPRLTCVSDGSLSLSGTVALHINSLAAVLSIPAVALQGDALSVVATSGERCSSVSGQLPGSVIFGLDEPMIAGGVTGNQVFHSGDVPGTFLRESTLIFAFEHWNSEAYTLIKLPQANFIRGQQIEQYQTSCATLGLQVTDASNDLTHGYARLWQSTCWSDIIYSGPSGGESVRCSLLNPITHGGLDTGYSSCPSPTPSIIGDPSQSPILTVDCSARFGCELDHPYGPACGGCDTYELTNKLSPVCVL